MNALVSKFSGNGPQRRDRLNPFVVLLPVSIAVLLSLATADFLSAENLLNLFNQAAPLLILSFGLLFPVLTGGIDISNGALLSVCAAFLVTFDPATGLLFSGGLAVFTGLCNGIGVAILKVHPIVMTLGVMIIFLGLSPIVLPAAGGEVSELLINLARGDLFGIPISLIWCVIASAVVWIVVSRSAFGTRVYAIGANEEAVWLSGVNSNIAIILCYVVSSVSAFFAAVYIVGRVGSSTATIGEPMIITSITAVAIGGVLLSGGIGSVGGVICGVTALTFINNGMNHLSVDPFLQQVITGCILLVAIGFQRREEIGV